MPAATIDRTDLIWDVTRERPTLGGALVLRQEGELLARRNGESAVTLHVMNRAEDRNAVDRLIPVVFAGSALLFRRADAPAQSGCWPTAALRARPEFSYFSFSRILAMHHETGLAPRLKWNESHIASARQARTRFAGELICIHLRAVPPFQADQSNADGPVWDGFFAQHARRGSLDFLLLGDDPLPAGLTLRPGLSRAADLGLGLATQLALIGLADGFLGMASGICTAANFCETPHVIFKHPAHHAREMACELGAVDRFPFARPDQRLWRRIADRPALDEALAMIRP